ncbi:unnamed protein product [Ixodes hexagonus]
MCSSESGSNNTAFMDRNRFSLPFSMFSCSLRVTSELSPP